MSITKGRFLLQWVPSYQKVTKDILGTKLM